MKFIDSIPIKNKIIALFVLMFLFSLLLVAKESWNILRTIDGIRKAEASVLTLQELAKVHGYIFNRDLNTLDYSTLEDALETALGDEDANVSKNIMFTLKEKHQKVRKKYLETNDLAVLKELDLVYSKVLKILESSFDDFSIAAVERREYSVYQLEWLLLLIVEENWYTRDLLHKEYGLYEEGLFPQESDSDFIATDEYDKLLTTIISQQIHLDKYFSSNKNSEDSLFLSKVINSKDFSHNTLFRQLLLGENDIDQVTSAQISSAFEDLTKRTNHIAKAIFSLQDKLYDEIDYYMIKYLFILISYLIWGLGSIGVSICYFKILFSNRFRVVKR